MATQRIQQMTLPEVALSQIKFTPLEYKPVQTNTELLQHSLDNYQQRTENLLAKQTAVDVALGDYENKLHKDAETDKWWADYKQKIKNSIQVHANALNLGDAIKAAHKAAGDIKIDAELQSRLKANSDYSNWEANLAKLHESKRISSDTRDWAKDKNKYHFEPEYDEEGNIIGGTTFDPNNLPLDDIDWAAETAKAAQLYVPSTTTKNRTRGYDENHSNTEGSFGSHWNKTNNFTTKEVTPQNIIDVLHELFNTNSDLADRVKQDYDVKMWSLEKSEKKLEDLKAKREALLETGEDTKSVDREITDLENFQRIKYSTLYSGNGGKITDFAEYYLRMTDENKFAEYLAYKNSSTTDSYTHGDSNHSKETQQIDPYGGNPNMGGSLNYSGGNRYEPRGLWPGFDIKKQTGTGTTPNGTTVFGG